MYCIKIVSMENENANFQKYWCLASTCWLLKVLFQNTECKRGRDNNIYC